MTLFDSCLGNMIKDKRIELELTQSELAKEVQISGGYLSKIERGVISPSFKVAEKVLSELKVI